MRGSTMAWLLTVVALLAAADARAQDQEVEWLFVQTADSVTLKDGELTLFGISPATLFFSDRPERIAGHGLTAEFVTFWQRIADDGFGADPPNATLAIVSNDVADDVVLTLMTPELDGSTLRYPVMNPELDGSMLRYPVTVLEGDEEVEGGPCSLFVDPVGMPLTPVSVSGVARRTTRRTVRRIAY
ncbi:MAG: hypothetical protein P8Y26_07725 [Gemmatimonadales bacterium]